MNQRKTVILAAVGAALLLGAVLLFSLRSSATTPAPRPSGNRGVAASPTPEVVPERSTPRSRGSAGRMTAETPGDTRASETEVRSKKRRRPQANRRRTTSHPETETADEPPPPTSVFEGDL